MQKKYILFLLIINVHLLSAQSIIEPCQSGQFLVDALQANYIPDSTLGYGPARDTLYSKIDNVGQELSGIYTGFTVTLESGRDPSVSAFQNERGLNAEHVYPQSKGARNEPGRSDMHNLYPSKVNVNSARGSCIFGDIDDDDTEFWFVLGEQLSQMPTSNRDEYSEKDEESCVFEPRESVKGDIARAVFYFYTIYQRQADNAAPNFFDLQKETLLAWHQKDPVDEKEIRRNELIASYQGNENPFVIDSTLARRAFFEADAMFEEGSPNCITTSSRDLEKENWINLRNTIGRNGFYLQSNERDIKVTLVHPNGQIIQQQKFDYDTRLETSQIENGYYFLVAQKGKQKTVFKVIALK
ncbi:MAG: endonuclease [Bacteroidota bacterium]